MNDDYKLIARDHFALAALNGLLANKNTETRLVDDAQVRRIATLAYAIADEMITTRQLRMTAED